VFERVKSICRKSVIYIYIYPLTCTS
jgi:hypothetical protein